MRPDSRATAKTFLKALTNIWGTAGAVTYPVYKDKAARFLTPELNVDNKSVGVIQATDLSNFYPSL